jgi:hypothetical protein
MFWKKKNILIVLGLALVLIASVANADYIFGTPTVITTYHVTAPSVSTDGLTMYVDAYEPPDGYGGWDILVYTRETIHDEWSEWENLGPMINTNYNDGNPDITDDGLTLFFNSWRSGDNDIYMTTRATKDDDWSEPVNLGPPINGPYIEGQPCISADGLSLYFCSDRPGGEGDWDIYVSTRATTSDPWSEPENLGPIVNSSSWDSGPTISSDGLMLFFDSERPGGYGLQDIWVTTRATKEGDWSEPVNLGPVINNSSYNHTSFISADGSIFYWFSTIGRLRQVPVIPIVDFSGDGFIDTNDLLIMIDNWGTDESLCDIGPMPFGDGVVDIEDLKVFMEYWEQENMPEVTEEVE